LHGRQYTLLYVLLFALVGAIGILATEIFTGRVSSAQAAGEDLIVTLQDASGVPLANANVFVFDADDPSGDFIASGFSAPDGVLEFDGIAGSLTAGNVLITAAQANFFHPTGFALSATASIPAEVTLSASGTPLVDVTVVDENGDPLGNTDITVGARPGRLDSAGETAAGSGTISIYLSPGTHLIEATDCTGSYYFLPHQALGPVTVFATTTAIVLDARDQGAGTIAANIDGIGSTWSSYWLAPVVAGDFLGAPIIQPPPGVPITLSAGAYDNVSLNLRGTTTLHNFDFQFQIFQSLVVTNGSSAAATVGGDLVPLVSAPTSTDPGVAASVNYSIEDSYGNVMTRASRRNSDGSGWVSLKPALTVTHPCDGVVHTFNDWAPFGHVLPALTTPGSYTVTMNLPTHLGTSTAATAFTVTGTTTCTAIASGQLSLHGVNSTSTLASIGPTVTAQSLDSAASSTAAVGPDGSFEVTGLPIGERFHIWASADGFLTSEITSITLSSSSTQLADVELKAGLVDGDGVVSIRDISVVAASFGESVSNRTDDSNRIVDVNGDGDVDILDISAVASNFGAVSPQAWPTQ
jgi:hypothetical protein